jgi:predicted transposase/invertase (TIGR01784 family)
MDSMKGRDYIISAEARGEARGEAKGKAEGEEKKAIEIAKAMLTKNKPMEEIIEFTGLTIKQIEKLK